MVALNPTQNTQLESYTEMLLQWNAIHSLSGAKNKEEIKKNILSSLYPLNFLHSSYSLLLDVGSGNGFPGIPLGIALNCQTILCEPQAKKAAFLQNIKANLALKHFTIQRKKIESLHLNLDSVPTLITSRATFSIQTFLEKCQHCITPQTTILLFKGSCVENEIPNGLKYTRFVDNLLQYIVILGKDLKC